VNIKDAKALDLSVEAIRMEFTVTFELEKETKNTYRYQEQVTDTPHRIGSLYVQKWALGRTPPKTLTVTVEG